MMFTYRTARIVGLALVVFFLSTKWTMISVSAQEEKGKKEKKEEKEEKKDEKKTIRSKLKIHVPHEKAELWIENEKTKVAGAVREFSTPDLEVGKEYYYAFKVIWEPNNYTHITRTKTIKFKAGDEVEVDLTKPDPKNADTAKIRWVPTPEDIVDEMIKLGGVKKGDVAYEPGPGDARVLIAAVKAGADKGVGIEIDPKKAEDAKESVKKAGLDKKITIIEGDALKDRDYSEATIVFLYMGNEFNALLKPVLEKQLKPGTRIVSHRFLIGDWAPDKTIKVKGASDGEEYILHLWTVKEKKPK